MAHAVEQHGISERRASKLVGIERMSYRYEPRPDHNAALREELATLARQKPRWGYRRLHILLEKRGVVATSQRVTGCTGKRAWRCVGCGASVICV